MNRLLYFWIAVIVCTLPSCAITQQSQVETDDSQVDVQGNIDQIQVDNLQNIYILTADNKIYKYDQDLVLKYQFANRQQGDIISIDATNPQKILCFVKDYNRILVLDNTLAQINTIDLATSEYLDVESICRSNDNRIWLFDPINQVLVKIDNQRKPLYTSNRLSDYNLETVQASILREKNNRVVLVDQDYGILIFDNFGQFLKLIPESDIDHIQIFGDYIFFAQGGKSYQYNIKTYEKSELGISEAGFSKFYMTKEFVYFFGKNGMMRKTFD